MKTITFYPSGLQVLQMLDEVTDAFNGHHDTGPKGSYLYPREAQWRRARKYESEDLGDQRHAFERACESLELGPEDLPALKDLLHQAVQLMRSLPETAQHCTDWEAYEPMVLQAFEAHPDTPLQAWREADTHNDLWLRAALQLRPQWPAPWQAWLTQLWGRYSRFKSIKNSSGFGSENWTWENHLDANWGCCELVRVLQERGWLPEGAVMDAWVEEEKAKK